MKAARRYDNAAAQRIELVPVTAKAERRRPASADFCGESGVEVRPGYKQTELGVIPEDWEVKRIADFASVGFGGTPSREIAEYWDGSVPWITTSQIDFGVITEADQRVYAVWCGTPA